MGKKATRSAGNVRPGGMAAKNPETTQDWHMTTETPEPTSPPQMLDVVSRWLSRKSEPEIKQAIAALGVMAQEHRQAGRIEQAEMTEAHIPLMRNYLTKVLPLRMAQRKGSDLKLN